ncbi:hypothetical protein [Stappia sp. WLB 29]|uniref:hypothetical protein n=1 Tax=Stappia sp. WLB 29 TaxID=2925220 RepID=UPI0020BE8BC9|nr:hypothetical protein [Stappia sp. WLB 29]
MAPQTPPRAMAPPSSEATSRPPKPVEDFASFAAAEVADLSGLACEDAVDAEDVGLAAPLPEPAAPEEVEEEDGADEDAAPEEGVAAAGLAVAAGPEDDGDVAEDANDSFELPEDAPLADEAEADDDAPTDGLAPAEAAPGVELLAEPDAGLAVDWPVVVLLAGFDAADVDEGEDDDPEEEELPAEAEDVEAVFAAPTSLACRSMVTGLRPAPAAAAPLASVAFGSPAFRSADVEAVLLGSGFLLSAAMNGLSLGSFTGAGYRHGASIARPAASLPLTPLSMFAALAVQNKSAPWRVSPQAKKTFQRPHIAVTAMP